MPTRLIPRQSLIAYVGLIAIAAASARDEGPSLHWGVLVSRGDGSQVEWHDHGAELRNGELLISREDLNKMDFRRNGLAEVIVQDHGWYYVNRIGKSLSVITFDNGADYFAEGLTRSKIGGKISYFDRNFNQFIPPKYDWGWPFENGKALVCNGCRETPRDSDGHSRMIGGQWGYIDKKGKEIVPVTLTEDEALRRLKKE